MPTTAHQITGDAGCPRRLSVGHPYAFLLCCFIAACTSVPPISPDQKASTSEPEVFEAVPVMDIGLGVNENAPAEFQPSLVAQSDLWREARTAEQEALKRSAAQFAISAAQGDAAAERAGRLPRVRPVAGIATTGDTVGEPTFGVSFEQDLWDFGARRAQIERAETGIMIAKVDQWIEMNGAVFDALEAYLAFQRSAHRLELYRALEMEIQELTETVAGRFEGGITGRSEALKTNLVLQELKRDILDEASDKAAAEVRYRTLLNNEDATLVPVPLTELMDDCTVDVGAEDPPEAFRVRLLVQQAVDDQTVVQSRRFPTLLGSADVLRNNGGWDTALGLRLDASALLGWDAGARLTAAAQRVQGAQQDYRNVYDSVRLDIGQLQDEYIRLEASLKEFESLLASSRENQALFDDLFASGTATLDDNLQLSREITALLRDQSDQKVSLLRTCLRIGRIQGTLTRAEIEE